MNDKPINIEYNAFHAKLTYFLDEKKIEENISIIELLEFVFCNEISSFKVIQYDKSEHDGMILYNEIRKLFG